MKTKLLKNLTAFCVAILAFSLVFTSCDDRKNIPQSELEGYWVLKTLNGKDAKSVFAGALPTLTFNFADTTISGTGGCNTYRGPFKYEKGVFNAPGIASTLMACTVDNQEPEFLLALSNENNALALEDGVLKFTFAGSVTLEFEKGTPQSEEAPVSISKDALSGNWTLKSIDGIDAKTKFANNTTPTITFSVDENRVYGNDGCNNYNAPFTLADNGALVLGPIVSTRMACNNMEGVAQFTQAIADSSFVSLPDAGTLQVSKNGTVLLEFQKDVAVASDSTKVAK